MGVGAAITMDIEKTWLVVVLFELPLWCGR